jgi:hypothetical protein
MTKIELDHQYLHSVFGIVKALRWDCYDSAYVWVEVRDDPKTHVNVPIAMLTTLPASVSYWTLCDAVTNSTTVYEFRDLLIYLNKTYPEFPLETCLAGWKATRG